MRLQKPPQLYILVMFAVYILRLSQQCRCVAVGTFDKVDEVLSSICDRFSPDRESKTRSNTMAFVMVVDRSGI